MNKAQQNRLETGISNWGPLPFEVASPQPTLLEGWVSVLITRGGTRWEVDLAPNGAPWVHAVAGK